MKHEQITLTDSVPSYLSQHGFSVFTSRYQEISMFRDLAEGEIGDGSRVTGTRERSLP